MKTITQSNICRLCAIDFENGSSLFELDENREIYKLIDEYLPIKLTKEAKLPTKICIGCKTNVQNVVKFFNSIIDGQKLLLKKTEECNMDNRNTSESSNETSSLDSEIRGNLRKIFSASTCKEWVKYEFCEEKVNSQVLLHCQNTSNFSIRKADSTNKGITYPKNGRKYFTKEANMEQKSNDIDLEDKHTPNKIFICDICGKKFSHRSSVLYHFHTKHGENQLYNCNECNKKFSSTRLLKRHFKRIHSVNSMFECIQCLATFISEEQLKNHVKMCKPNILNCEPRDKPHKFKNKSECQKDNDRKEYHCKVCDKTFKYSSNLYRHQKLHSTERPYQCTKCNRKFPTLSRLKMHENEHNKEYSYKCNICQKTFVNNRILRVHYRRHTRVFPFQCDVCCKGFPDKCSIVKHMRVHTGERPYSCESCEKTFADQSNFLRHKKAHDKNQKSIKNPRLNSFFRKAMKSNLSKAKLRMEIDYNSMTYSNDVSNSKDKFTSSLNHLPTVMSPILNDSENDTERKDNKSCENRSHFKKSVCVDNSVKQFLSNSPRPDKNSIIVQPSLVSFPIKPVHQNEEKSSPLILKSTKSSNSFVIVKKENTPILNDSTKVIVIRSRNKHKSKFIVQRSLEPVVKKEILDTPNRKEDVSKQNQLPELYSCEKMLPSPTSEYIDVEDLVATFTPNISFEEIGDLNDLVNTKIDL